MDSKTKDALQQAGITIKGRYARGNAGLISARARRRMEEKVRRDADKRQKAK